MIVVKVLRLLIVDAAIDKEKTRYGPGSNVESFCPLLPSLCNAINTMAYPPTQPTRKQFRLPALLPLEATRRLKRSAAELMRLTQAKLS